MAAAMGATAGRMNRVYRTPAEHGALLHPPSRPGSVCIGQRMAGGRPETRWVQRCYPVADLPEILPALAEEEDVYITHNRFWGRRKITHLAELGALALDLDFYRIPEFRGASASGVLLDVLTVLERRRLPAPSLAVGSGRGLYLFWLHSPVPRAALPRWNACQRELVEALEQVGADKQAKDAARVLRVVGTRHRGAGVMVEALTPPGDVWEFSDLADEILPYTRAEMADIRIQKAARRAERPQKSLWTPPEGFTAATLWESRLTDLQRLREIRWFGEPMPDYRNRWLFLAGVGMSYIAIPTVLQRELFALAHQVGGWSDGHTRSKMHAVFRTVREHWKRERDDRGRHTGPDPRYRFHNQTIIDWLEITAAEEREMQTIISGDERRRRDRERKRKDRRQAGAVPQAERQAATEERRREAHRLRSEGLSYRKIAARLDISHEAVRKLLSRPVSKGVNPASGCMVAEGPREAATGERSDPGGVPGFVALDGGGPVFLPSEASTLFSGGGAAQSELLGLEEGEDLAGGGAA
jgi:hypothetical protein